MRARIDRVLRSAEVVRCVIDSEDPMMVDAIVCNTETQVFKGGVIVATGRCITVGCSAG